MPTFGVRETQNRMEELIARAIAGEEIAIRYKRKPAVKFERCTTKVPDLLTEQGS